MALRRELRRLCMPLAMVGKSHTTMKLSTRLTATCSHTMHLCPGLSRTTQAVVHLP